MAQITVRRAQLSQGYQTLYFTLPNGETLMFGMMDPQFNALTEIIDQQKEIARENKDARERYQEKLANFQGELDSGRAGKDQAPEKPQMQVVDSQIDDDGVITWSIKSAPFSPPLPDPKYPVQSKSGQSPAQTGPTPAEAKINPFAPPAKP